MGCDIHAHIEVRIGDHWHHYSKVATQRSYTLFGRLAGMRRTEEPHIKPRGFPQDPSHLTEIEWRHGQNYHTPSWLTGAELEPILDVFFCPKLPSWDEVPEHVTRGYSSVPAYDSVARGGFGYLAGNGFDGPFPVLDVITDCRIVFWFDN